LKVTADELIRDMLENRGPGTLVVTSDRQVQAWASHAGADWVDSASFIRRINEVRTELPEDGEDDDEGWDGTTKKRGNPHRLPKRERGAAKRLKKL
jgi:predicted RNA-binding protein with PIN domain